MANEETKTMEFSAEDQKKLKQLKIAYPIQQQCQLGTCPFLGLPRTSHSRTRRGEDWLNKPFCGL